MSSGNPTVHNSPKATSAASAKNYSSAIAKETHSILSSEDRNKIMERLSTVAIDNRIAQISVNDVIENSKLVPYYKNPSRRLWSTFENPHADLRNINDINLLLIDGIEGSQVEQIDYNEISKPSSKITVKDKGSCEGVERLVKELVFILRLKSGIDYENSTYAGASDLLKFTLKYSRNISLAEKTSFTFTPQDHRYLQDKLLVRDSTLAYKASLQTITLVAYHLRYVPDGHFGKLIKRAIDPSEQNSIVLRRNLNDLSGVDPFHMWTIVMSPEERELIKEVCDDRDVFKLQNNMLAEFRKPGQTEVKKISDHLQKLNTLVKTRIGQNGQAVIFGRLKQYHAFKKDAKNHSLFLKKGKIIDLGYTAVLEKMFQIGIIDLFSEDSLESVLSGIYKSGTEVRDLTTKTRFDVVTRRTYYEFDEIKSVKTIKDLVSRSSKNEERATKWLERIKNRTPKWDDDHFKIAADVAKKIKPAPAQKEKKLLKEDTKLLDELRRAREVSMKERAEQIKKSAELKKAKGKNVPGKGIMRVNLPSVEFSKMDESFFDNVEASEHPDGENLQPSEEEEVESSLHHEEEEKNDHSNHEDSEEEDKAMSITMDMSKIQDDFNEVLQKFIDRDHDLYKEIMRSPVYQDILFDLQTSCNPHDISDLKQYPNTKDSEEITQNHIHVIQNKVIDGWKAEDVTKTLLLMQKEVAYYTTRAPQFGGWNSWILSGRIIVKYLSNLQGPARLSVGSSST